MEAFSYIYTGKKKNTQLIILKYFGKSIKKIQLTCAKYSKNKNYEEKKKDSNVSEETNLPNKPMEDGTIITPTDKVLFMEWMPSQS